MQTTEQDKETLAYISRTKGGLLPPHIKTAIRRLLADYKATEERLAEAERLLEEERTDLRDLLEAARCIRHWHDTGRNNEGMIVSAEHVRKLWEVRDRIAARKERP